MGEKFDPKRRVVGGGGVWAGTGIFPTGNSTLWGGGKQKWEHLSGVSTEAEVHGLTLALTGARG